MHFQSRRHSECTAKVLADFHTRFLCKVDPVCISGIVDELALEWRICFGNGSRGADMVIVTCLDDRGGEICQPSRPARCRLGGFEGCNYVGDVEIRYIGCVIGIFWPVGEFSLSDDLICQAHGRLTQAQTRLLCLPRRPHRRDALR